MPWEPATTSWYGQSEPDSELEPGPLTSEIRLPHSEEENQNNNCSNHSAAHGFSLKQNELFAPGDFWMTSRLFHFASFRVAEDSEREYVVISSFRVNWGGKNQLCLLVVKILSMGSAEKNDVSSQAERVAEFAYKTGGPGDIKICQSAESSPWVRDDYRKAFRKSKTDPDPPDHFEKIKMINDESVVPKEIREQIEYIGEVEGCGAYKVGVHVKLKDGQN